MITEGAMDVVVAAQLSWAKTAEVVAKTFPKASNPKNLSQ
jgi:hypothetical protein